MLAVLLTPAAALGWTARPTAGDPLVRLPGTQPGAAAALGDSRACLVCHTGPATRATPSLAWKGSMMGQSARDPLFWPTYAVALQDSIWAIGTPNVGDFCQRCHFPNGWLEGRADPPNASRMTDSDFDGVQCTFCHKTFDPYFVDTNSGAREGGDWTGYWDESAASALISPAVDKSASEDRADVASHRLFDGRPLFDATGRPVSSGWTESGSGEFFVSSAPDFRGPYADSTVGHPGGYSRWEKSKHYCASCHDISNPVLANLSKASATPGDGATVLPTESQPSYAYAAVERTFSEFMLSDFGQPGGAAGEGSFAPGVFTTPRPADLIATCQDCHMPAAPGRSANSPSGPSRPAESAAHPHSAQTAHDLTGANALSPALLAAAVPGSANFDATIAALLGKGPAALTLDLAQGISLDAPALLAGRNRALDTLARAAEIASLAYEPSTGAARFRVHNLTGHKLPSGFPEGRRAFVNVRLYAKGALLFEVNPYDAAAGTLKGLPKAYSPSSPALAAGESYRDELVYEAHSSSTLTGEAQTFHFALATGLDKDNRLPPRGFRIAEAAARLVVPVAAGVAAPDLFTAAEYAGGHDDVTLSLPAGGDRLEVRLLHQTISREYVEFLRSELAGTATSLKSPTPSGEAKAYVAQTDPFFARLAAWGETTFQLWQRAKDWPGAAPAKVAEATLVIDRCAGLADGLACDDGDPCTTGDVCAAGACKGPLAAKCDDGNPCTDDACEAKVGCRYSFNEAPCTPEPCRAGTCAFGVCIPGVAIWCSDAGAGDTADADGADGSDASVDTGAEAGGDAAGDAASGDVGDAPASDTAPEASVPGDVGDVGDAGDAGDTGGTDAQAPPSDASAGVAGGGGEGGCNATGARAAGAQGYGALAVALAFASAVAARRARLGKP